MFLAIRAKEVGNNSSYQSEGGWKYFSFKVQYIIWLLGFHSDKIFSHYVSPLLFLGRGTYIEIDTTS